MRPPDPGQRWDRMYEEMVRDDHRDRKQKRQPMTQKTADLIRNRVRRHGVRNTPATTGAWCWLDDARDRHDPIKLDEIVKRAQNDTIARRITRDDLERAERRVRGWHV